MYTKKSNVITSLEEYFVYAHLDNAETRHYARQLKTIKRQQEVYMPIIQYGKVESLVQVYKCGPNPETGHLELQL